MRGTDGSFDGGKRVQGLTLSASQHQPPLNIPTCRRGAAFTSEYQNAL
jgi:hypothetical protein